MLGGTLTCTHAPQMEKQAREHAEEESSDEEPPAVQTRWAKSFGAAVHDRLCDNEGGAASRLYHYLWCKDAQGRSPREFKLPDTARARPNGRTLPEALLPRPARPRRSRLTARGTAQIVYKYRLPTFWFFTSAQSGEARASARCQTRTQSTVLARC